MSQIKLVCLASAIILSGCTTAQIAPSKQAGYGTDPSKPDFAVLVKSLGDNTKAVSDKTKILFTEINSAQLNADITELADQGHLFLSPDGTIKLPNLQSNIFDGNKLNLPSVPTSKNGGNSKAIFIKGGFQSVENMDLGITALSNYGTAISSLASAGSRKDMELASANLYAAAIKVDANYQTIAGGQSANADDKKIAAIVSSAIVEIGSFYNTHKRNAALRKIITGADPQVQEICNTLSKGLEIDGFGDLIRANKQRVLFANINEYNFVITTTPTTLAWREGELKRLIALRSDLDKSAESITNVKKAIAAVGETHAALVKAVKDNNLNNADLFHKLNNLKSMVDHAKAYNETLLKCTSGKFKKDDSGEVVCQEES